MKISESIRDPFLPASLPASWSFSLALAVCFHFLVVAAALLLPRYFNTITPLPEIYTVNLFDAAELTMPPPKPAPAPPAPAAATPPPAPAPQKIKISEVQLKDTAPAAPPPPPADPISLEPVQTKLKVNGVEEITKTEQARLNKILDRLQSKAAERDAKTRADRAAIEAVSKLADSIKSANAAKQLQNAAASTAPTTVTAANPTASGPPGNDPVVLDRILKQYYASIYQQIKAHWVLPELQHWEKDLEAIVAITIRNDGQITKSYFKKKTTNIYFNQFVEKALRESIPLPPFPEELAQDPLEIGLRFTPGDLN